ncbi:hypothetical protein [Streptomyces hygroscopicus]|uniref:hypothetical protein n=1 Tax=Streptomyces hygroscopicus TaxID=1912 RepID=UPI000B0C3277
MDGEQALSAEAGPEAARQAVQKAGTPVRPADHPRPGQARPLADHQERVDEGAVETGLRALVAGLALWYPENSR